MFPHSHEVTGKEFQPPFQTTPLSVLPLLFLLRHVLLQEDARPDASDLEELPAPQCRASCRPGVQTRVGGAQKGVRVPQGMAGTCL